MKSFQKQFAVIFLTVISLMQYTFADTLINNNGAQATNPNPPDGAINVLTDITLSWTPGIGAVFHYVNFSDNPDDFNSTSMDWTKLISDTTFNPGTLDLGTTYYWRIDEYDAGLNITQGVVWSFTTFFPVLPSERTVVINEIMFDPIGEDAGNEWIELYNKGDANRNLEGWTISNSTGEILVTLPDYNLPEDGYLVVHFGSESPVNDSLDGKEHYYTYDLPLDYNIGDFNNVKGGAALYNNNPGAGSIIDYIGYSFFDIYPEIDLGITQEHAIGAGIWEPNEYVGAPPSVFFMRKLTSREGDSIGRDKDSTDTDSPSDWYNTGGRDAIGPTPDARNFNEVSFTPGTPLMTPLPIKKWTFMLYAAADTDPCIPGNDLEYPIFMDIDEMEQVGSNENLNLVFQFDGHSRVHEVTINDGVKTPVPGTYGKTFRGYIQPEPGGVKEPNLVYLYPAQDGQYFLGEKNTGDPNALAEFLEWATENFPAEKYALIIGGHGAGWKGVAPDDTSNEDWLYMGELKSALTSSISFDIIGFDACLMAMIEVGDQVINDTDILVASQEIEGGYGWPYDKILADLKANINWSGTEFAPKIVEHYHNFYSGDPLHTLSAVDLSGNAFITLLDNVNDFADDMLAEKAQDEWGLEDYDFEFTNHYDPDDNVQIEVKTALRQTEKYDDKNYNDLYDLMENIDNQDGIPEDYKRKCIPTMNSVLDAVIAEAHGDSHNDSHGLSIYFPRSQTRDMSTDQHDPFDIPWPSCVTDTNTPLAIYAADRSTEWGKVPAGHPLPETPDFEFGHWNLWSSFLHRYYKPVADAGEDQNVEIPSGEDGVWITLDGSGSSDSDGRVTRYIWDLNPTMDNDGEPDDWDKDGEDESDDDNDKEGQVTSVWLDEEGIYEFVLTVWDNHYLEEDPTPATYWSDSNDPNKWVYHNTHWKTDQDTCIVEVTKQEPATVEIPTMTDQPTFDPAQVNGVGQETTCTVPISTDAVKVVINIRCSITFTLMYEDTKTFEQGSNSVDFVVPLYAPSGQFHVNVYVYGDDNVYSYYEYDPSQSSTNYMLYQNHNHGSGEVFVGETNLPIGSIDVIMVWQRVIFGFIKTLINWLTVSY